MNISEHSLTISACAKDLKAQGSSSEVNKVDNKEAADYEFPDNSRSMDDLLHGIVSSIEPLPETVESSSK